jgi:hypothetical protein
VTGLLAAGIPATVIGQLTAAERGRVLVVGAGRGEAIGDLPRDELYRLLAADAAPSPPPP